MTLDTVVSLLKAALVLLALAHSNPNAAIQTEATLLAQQAITLARSALNATSPSPNLSHAGVLGGYAEGAYASTQAQPNPTPTYAQSTYYSEGSYTSSRQAASCTFNGQTISSGSSVTAYQSSSVSVGAQCANETRTCNNGSLSGSYAYTSCIVQQPLTIAGYDASPLPSSNNHAVLAAAFPNTRAVAFYIFLKSAIAANRNYNYADEFALIQKEIPKIKAAGFNTVLWSMPWQGIEPKPFSSGTDKWNATNISYLLRIMDFYKQSGVKVLFFLNYQGPGWSPDGIQACTWWDDPAQYSAYVEYVNTLVRLLRNYDDNTIFLEPTEQSNTCYQNEKYRYLVKGYDLISSPTQITMTPDITAKHKQALIDLTESYKRSIGRLPLDVAPDVRANAWFGLHDNFLLGINPLYSEFGIKNPPVQTNQDGTTPFDVMSIDAQFDTSPGLVDFIHDVQRYAKSHDEQSARAHASAVFMQGANNSMAGTKMYFPGSRMMLSEAWYPDIDLDAYPGPFFYKNLTDPMQEEFVNTLAKWSGWNAIPVFFWGWIPSYYDSYDTSSLNDGIAFTDRLGNFSSALKVLADYVCTYVKDSSVCAQNNPYYSQYGVEQKHQLRAGSATKTANGTTVTCDWGGNMYCGKASVGKGGQAITSTTACTWTGWASSGTAATYSCPTLSSGDVVFCEMFDYANDNKCQAQNSKVPVYIEP